MMENNENVVLEKYLSISYEEILKSINKEGYILILNLIYFMKSNTKSEDVFDISDDLLDQAKEQGKFKSFF